MASYSPLSSPSAACEREKLPNALVNLSHLDVVRQHWNIDVYCSIPVWTILLNAGRTEGKECARMLHEVFQAAKLCIGERGGGTLIFQCPVGASRHNFELHCGPGHTPIPVLTLDLRQIDALPIS